MSDCESMEEVIKRMAVPFGHPVILSERTMEFIEAASDPLSIACVTCVEKSKQSQAALQEWIRHPDHHEMVLCMVTLACTFLEDLKNST